jgi:hypothetical protein
MIDMRALNAMDDQTRLGHAWLTRWAQESKKDNPQPWPSVTAPGSGSSTKALITATGYRPVDPLTPEAEATDSIVAHHARRPARRSVRRLRQVGSHGGGGARAELARVAPEAAPSASPGRSSPLALPNRPGKSAVCIALQIRIYRRQVPSYRWAQLQNSGTTETATAVLHLAAVPDHKPSVLQIGRGQRRINPGALCALTNRMISTPCNAPPPIAPVRRGLVFGEP